MADHEPIEPVDQAVLTGKDEIDEDDEMELSGADLAVGDDLDER